MGVVEDVLHSINDPCGYITALHLPYPSTAVFLPESGIADLQLLKL